MASRSGSEKRQRKHILPTRYNDEELARVRASARARGCSASAFVRATSLQYRLPLSRVDLEAVARLLGQLGKIGSNINQYVKSRNMGRESDNLDLAMEAALRDLAELRIVCLQALGKEPRREKYSGDED